MKLSIVSNDRIGHTPTEVGIVTMWTSRISVSRIFDLLERQTILLTRRLWEILILILSNRVTLPFSNTDA